MPELLVGPLVRAISARSVVVWAEVSQPCWVTLQATVDHLENDTVPCSVTTYTVTVGGRHYAAPQLSGLHSATWYNYKLLVHQQKDDSPQSLEDHAHADTLPLFYCFRTLDGTGGSSGSPKLPRSLRIAYGSCRKSGEPEQDALSAFGNWLLQHQEQREEQWPRLLLLIGDQIYADQPPAILKEAHPTLRDGAQSFADFATLYSYVWTQDSGVRQVLAMLPTFMIFDDHEVTSLVRWNIVHVAKVTSYSLA